MATIFLSASVPDRSSERYLNSANPFLIQLAVRELIVATIQRYHLVWGGHPSITPMIAAICEGLGVDYGERVTLYQSLYFEHDFPTDNSAFNNVIRVEAAATRAESEARLRHRMLSHRGIVAGVFVGGMGGVLREFELFRGQHPKLRAIALGAPGGAAREITADWNKSSVVVYGGVDFAGFFQSNNLFGGTESSVPSLPLLIL